MNLFCSHLTATLNLLMLGNVGTLRAASALFIVLGRCTQRPYRASAFDFIVEFAIARHSLNKFNSALAYTQISLTRRFSFCLLRFFICVLCIRFIHPLPPAGYSRLSQGESFGYSVVTDCPSKLGGEESL